MSKIQPRSRSVINKELSVSEQAAIYWAVFGGETDWKRVYMAAAGWNETEAEENTLTLAQYTSRWKGTAKFKREFQRVSLIKERMIKDIQDVAYEEGRRAAIKQGEAKLDEDAPRMVAGQTDYTDPRAQKEKLNEIINTAKDSGEALDALKVIIQGQRQDTEAAKNNKVQRFYTPLQCRDCPLYLEAKEKK